MPKVYFDALSSSYVAGRAAGRIVDLLNFSFLNKMMQMIAWSSFLAKNNISMLPVTDPSLRMVKNLLKVDKFSPMILATNNKQRSPTSYLMLEA